MARINLLNFVLRNCAVALFAAASTGCTSYPFIDESIAKLDNNPVPVAQKFNLPETPPPVIAPQSSELLVGDWMTGFHNQVYREIGQDGLLHEYPDHKGAAEVYEFYADGSYGHNGICQMGALLIQLKRFGKWSYDSGLLTLKCEKAQWKVQNFAAKQLGAPNWEEEFPYDMKGPEITTKRVEWFAYNEIAITSTDKTAPPTSGSRESVEVDAYGVRTIREIKVQAMKEGRETGTVEETISPPMHFKLKEKAD